MLENINIINLAIVESLDLNLNQGLSVLTGETGAGKSILLTALGLALGDRAEAGFIRPNCQRAEINLSFNCFLKVFKTSCSSFFLSNPVLIKIHVN